MPAFTQLCSKINISLMDDVITIYPKDSRTMALVPETQDFEGILVPFIEANPHLIKFSEHVQNTPRAKEEWGIAGFVQRIDPNHNRYHQDKLDEKFVHFHLRFYEPISKELFEKLLTLYCQFELVTLEEKKGLLIAYQLATHPIDIESRPSSSSTPTEKTGPLNSKIPIGVSSFFRGEPEVRTSPPSDVSANNEASFVR